MKRILRNIILLANIICAFFMILSYIAAFVSPETCWPLAFFGLMYPFLLIVNILFLIFWIIFRKFFFLISLVCMMAGLPFIRRLIQVNTPFHSKAYYKEKYLATNNSFKLLTFNVRLFNLYKWEGKTDVENGIFKFIEKESPDIICFQEFYARDNSSLSEKQIAKSLNKCHYSHVAYSLNKKNASHFGIATFSSYPIVGKGELKFPHTYNLSIYTDLKIGNDTIRIYNNHLQSIKFLKSDYELIDTIKLEYDGRQMNGIKRMTIRVRDAFKKRARQVDAVAEHIRHSPYPVIVCGDFNDSPVSYSYQTMRGKLKDAFIETGNGIGYTYRGKFPSYRIDYILHDPLFKSFDYESPKLELSDHYPVFCRFTLP